MDVSHSTTKIQPKFGARSLLSQRETVLWSTSAIMANWDCVSPFSSSQFSRIMRPFMVVCHKDQAKRMGLSNLIVPIVSIHSSIIYHVKLFQEASHDKKT